MFLKQLELGRSFRRRLLGHRIKGGQEFGDFLEVLLDHAPERGLVESRGRVVDRVVDHAALPARPPVDAADRLAREELGHRIAAEGHNQPGANGRDLPVQEVRAGSDLSGQWIAIVRRTTLDNVGDKDLVAGQADRPQEFIEELPGRPYEWLALLVLVVARGFTDEHDPGSRRTR